MKKPNKRKHTCCKKIKDDHPFDLLIPVVAIVLVLLFIGLQFIN